ncbi:MAG: hypothetical protein ACSLFM_06845 [Tepidiformaceae bacterium]
MAREEPSAATSVPGTVVQSSTAEDAGTLIGLEKAVFTARGVDAWVRITPSDPGLEPAGVSPQAASLSGVSAESVRVHAGGVAVLRFPSGDFTGALVLQIAAVQVLGEGDRKETIAGDWRLAMIAPPEADLEEARRIEPLGSVEADADGARIMVEGFRMASATVVRYYVPPTVTAMEAPVLRVGESLLQADRVESADGRAFEAWYQATDDRDTTTLVMNGLFVLKSGTGGATFTVRIEPFSPPPRGTEGEVDKRELAWTSRELPVGYEVLSIDWRRDLDAMSSLVVRVEGLWDPAQGGKPVLLADGVPLEVRGTGLYPKTPDDNPFTTVEARLPTDAAPSEITLIMGGVVESIGPVEAVLRR